MKKIYLLTMLAAGLLFSGCSKENPFDGGESGEGKVMKSALDMSVAESNVRKNVTTRSENEYSLDNFMLSFVKDGQSIATKSVLYGEMPEVITLPVGTYTVTAVLGENRDAEWENPYFIGKSTAFEVSAYEITSYIEPIECELQNIKATVEFASSLREAIGDDAYVEIKVGSSNGLKYTANEVDAGKAGYFRHTEETTLVAVFHGTIDGANVVETKSYSNIAKGCWYHLTFKLHGGDVEGSGDADGNIVVDASVDVVDINADINVADDDPLDDGERPEDGGESGSDPIPGDNAPEFEAVTPGLVFDTPFHVTLDSSCKFKINSSAEGGFTVLTCDIISEDLTPEELSGMGIPAHLDLINTAPDVASALGGLGFPVNVGGQKSVTFDLTPFMGMMGVFGNHQHEFKISVTDANGTTTKSLILQF